MTYRNFERGMTALGFGLSLCPRMPGGLHMAYVGELVRMSSGRWARFTTCESSDSASQERAPILVAVELEERLQQVLDAAEHSLESYRRQDVFVRMRLDTDAAGDVRVEFAAQHPV